MSNSPLSLRDSKVATEDSEPFAEKMQHLTTELKTQLEVSNRLEQLGSLGYNI